MGIGFCVRRYMQMQSTRRRFPCLCAEPVSSARTMPTSLSAAPELEAWLAANPLCCVRAAV